MKRYRAFAAIIAVSIFALLFSSCMKAAGESVKTAPSDTQASGESVKTAPSDTQASKELLEFKH